jgi:hypothetical protein
MSATIARTASDGSADTRQNAPGDGSFDSTGTTVQPSSLYAAQLCERLGSQALAAIGY